MRKSTAHVADGTESQDSREQIQFPTRKALRHDAVSLQYLCESDEGEQENDSQAEKGALDSASAAPASCSTEPERSGRGKRQKLKS
jgi:hypothetical protein